jgi:hypothetical protein
MDSRHMFLIYNSIEFVLHAKKECNMHTTWVWVGGTHMWKVLWCETSSKGIVWEMHTIEVVNHYMCCNLLQHVLGLVVMSLRHDKTTYIDNLGMWENYGLPCSWISVTLVSNGLDRMSPEYASLRLRYERLTKWPGQSGNKNRNVTELRSCSC